MPQDGSNNYQYPPGTPGIPDTTIESEAYNTFLDDLVTNDLNIPRPIHRGGTGANNADNALVNLTAEKATQLVTDYGTQVWLPGSFYSATSATAAPVAGHAFAGICYINEPLVFPPTNANVTVEARDMTDGKIYVRIKTAGVWSIAGWVVDGASDYVNVTGDTMTGPLTLSADPVNPLHAATKQYTTAKAGDIMTGFLTLVGTPTANLHAATKQYVDGGVDGVTGGLTAKVDKAGGAGGVMTGLLTLSADPTALMHAATKQYVDASTTAAVATATVAMADNGMQINGTMDVTQENGSGVVAIPSGSSLKYLVDCFRINKSGTSTLNAQQTASVFPGFLNELKFTVTTAQASIGGNNIILETPIEGYRFQRVGWGTASAIPITVGLWVKSSVAGGLLLQMTNSAGDIFINATATITAANTAQFITATFAAATTGTWLGMTNTGAIFKIYLATSGQINVAATVGNTFEVTGVVILPSTMTLTAAQAALMVRSYDQDLQMCKRYYNLYAQFLVQSTMSTSVAYPAQMRGTPTVSGGGAGFSLSGTSNNRVATFFQSAAAFQDLVMDARL